MDGERAGPYLSRENDRGRKAPDVGHCQMLVTTIRSVTVAIFTET